MDNSTILIRKWSAMLHILPAGEDISDGDFVFLENGELKRTTFAAAEYVATNNSEKGSFVFAITIGDYENASFVEEVQASSKVEIKVE
jgi:hypothetical protein